MQDKLGFLFENPLETFEANSKPTEYDIVCRWIFEYDKVRGTKRFMNKKKSLKYYKILKAGSVCADL